MAELEPWEPDEERVVTDAAAADILWHPNKRVHLRPFLAQSADLAAASQELRMQKTAMSYWIGRLLEAGLIRVAGIEKRGRHQVRFYRCVAKRFRLGLKDAPLETYEDVFDDFSRRWSGELRAALGRELAKQAASLELSFSSAGAAGLAVTIQPRDGVEPPPDDYIFYWARLWLAEDEEDALRRDLDAVYDKYARLSDEANKPVAVLMHMAAVREKRRP